jgi:hypothetical protein
MCNTEIETNQHILTCNKCPIRNQLRKKYFLDLGIIFDNNRIDKSTKTVITYNVRNWLENKETTNINSIEPHATSTLQKAANEQQQIGWDHWIKGRWSLEWATLINHDLKNSDTGKK